MTTPVRPMSFLLLTVRTIVRTIGMLLTLTGWALLTIGMALRIAGAILTGFFAVTRGAIRFARSLS